MAIDFDGTQRLEYTNWASLPPPYSVGCWFQTDNVTGITTPWSQGQPAGSNFDSILIRGNVGGDPWSFGPNGANEARATGIVQGDWHWGLAVHASLTDRRAFVDTNKGTDTDLQAQGGVYDALYWAEVARSASGLNLDGRLAHGAMWNRALSDQENAFLSQGYSPEFIPQGLIHYWRMNDPTDIRDRIGTAHLTAIGAPQPFPPPDVISPSVPIIVGPAAIVVGGRIMSSLVDAGGLAGRGGIAGIGGGLAG